MIKKTYFLTKGAGLDCDAFKQKFEDRIVPALQSSTDRLARIGRSYVTPDDVVELAHIPDVPPPPPFDVILQLWFDYETVSDAMDDGAWEAAEQVVFSDNDLFDQSFSEAFWVNECRTPRPGVKDGDPSELPNMIKMILLARRRPDLTHEYYVEGYERDHAPFATEKATMFARYRRNFPLPEGRLSARAFAEGESPYAPLDVITETWYYDEEGYAAFGALFEDPEIGAQFIADEKRLFDRTTLQMFTTHEIVTSIKPLDE